MNRGIFNILNTQGSALKGRNLQIADKGLSH